MLKIEYPFLDLLAKLWNSRVLKNKMPITIKMKKLNQFTYKKKLSGQL